MFARMEPKTLLWLLILAAIFYLVLPYDLFPDFFGLPGRLDDLVVIGWLAWLYRSYTRDFVRADDRSASSNDSAGGPFDAGAGSRPEASRAFDPYQVLGISRSASGEVIRDAYRARMKEYHPDKVAHLGEALQELAHEKSQQIERAYRELRR